MKDAYLKEILEVVATHLDIPVDSIIPIGEQPKDVVVVTGGGCVPPELLINLPRKNIEE